MSSVPVNKACGYFLCVFVVFVILFSVFETNKSLHIVVVPGGGLRSDGKLPDYTILRLQKALELCNYKTDAECMIATLSFGTVHKAPPVDFRGFPISESVMAAKYLVDVGFPPERILEENISLDTVGNAYFLRAIHIQPMVESSDFLYIRLTVITNNWHMKRTQVV